MTFRSFNTHVFARVFRHDGREPLELTTAVEGTSPKDLGSIVAASQTKQLGGGPGQWSLSIKAGRHDLLAEVSANDWVVLWWTRDGVAYHGTLGLVDGIRRARHSVGGATAIGWTISGRDFTKVFDETKIWFNDYAEFETNVGGKILAARHNYVPGGTPDAVVRNIIDAFLGQEGIIGGAWKLPKGLSYLGDYFVQGLQMLVQDGFGNERRGEIETRVLETLEQITPTKIELRGELFDEASLFQPEPGAVMSQILQTWANPLLNELFYDVATKPGGALVRASSPEEPIPLVIHREKPFINVGLGIRSPWFNPRAIPVVHLARTDIVTDDVGVSDQERANLFLLYSSNNGMTNLDHYALYPPSYDREGVRKHGIRKMENQTPFSGIGGKDGGGTWLEEVNRWHGLLLSWYAMNHEYLNGTIVAGYVVPEARVGSRLVVGDDDDREREQFYIEGVSHQWSFPRGGSSTFSVTRGWRGSDESYAWAHTNAASRYQRDVRLGAIRFPTKEGDIVPADKIPPVVPP